ncbi:MAG TPA: hypothetical protein PLE43_04035 [Alphaproteobacteria bacterium]|nr:hypothetical protein [Alphaproteobacteria bacterium]
MIHRHNIGWLIEAFRSFAARSSGGRNLKKVNVMRAEKPQFPTLNAVLLSLSLAFVPPSYGQQEEVARAPLKPTCDFSTQSVLGAVAGTLLRGIGGGKDRSGMGSVAGNFAQASISPGCADRSKFPHEQPNQEKVQAPAHGEARAIEPTR